jgi:hypothetical protein
MTITIMRRSTFFGTGESAGIAQLSMSILRAQIALVQAQGRDCVQDALAQTCVEILSAGCKLRI